MPVCRKNVLNNIFNTVEKSLDLTRKLTYSCEFYFLNDFNGFFIKMFLVEYKFVCYFKALEDNCYLTRYSSPTAIASVRGDSYFRSEKMQCKHTT